MSEHLPVALSDRTEGRRAVSRDQHRADIAISRPAFPAAGSWESWLLRRIIVVFVAVLLPLGCTSALKPQPAFSQLTTSPNLLTGDNASFDGGAGSWGAPSAAVVSDTASPVQAGSGALEITAQGLAPITVAVSSGQGPSTWIKATPGLRYTATAYLQAGTIGRSIVPLEVFYDANGSKVGDVFGRPVTDAVGAWTPAGDVTGLSPAGTAYVALGFLIHDADNGEVHYLDSASVTYTTANNTPIQAPFHVSGNGIYGADGKRVVFRGIHRDGSQKPYPVFPTDAEIGQARAWGANFIRVPLNESLWVNTCDRRATNQWWYPGAIDQEVKQITSRGMVALLDLHESVARPCGSAAMQPMADAQYAPTFWAQVAARYKSNPYVAFDLYNEPHDITDAVWLNGGTVTNNTMFKTVGMQQLYNIVRQQGAQNLIFISGNKYAVQPTAKLVSGTNIVNAVHAYTCGDGPPPGCQTPDYYNPTYILNKWATLGQTQPVMVTEFGWPTADDPTFDRNVIAVAEYRGWGWDAFVWDGGTNGMYGLVASMGSTYEPTPAGMPVLAGLAKN